MPTKPHCTPRTPTKRNVSAPPRRRKAISMSRRFLPQRGQRARRPSTRATASWLRMPSLRRASRRPGSCSSAPRPPRSRRWGIRRARGRWRAPPACRLCRAASDSQWENWTGSRRPHARSAIHCSSKPPPAAAVLACAWWKTRISCAKSRKRPRPWRRAHSGMAQCFWSVSSRRRGMSKSRSSVSAMAARCISLSAIARCSGVSRK